MLHVLLSQKIGVFTGIYSSQCVLYERKLRSCLSFGCICTFKRSLKQRLSEELDSNQFKSYHNLDSQHLYHDPRKCEQRKDLRRLALTLHSHNHLLSYGWPHK